MFQKYSRCSAIFFLFFASPQAQKSCLARPPVWRAIESVNFTDFVQRRATANSIAHGILSYCKLQDVFS